VPGESRLEKRLDQLPVLLEPDLKDLNDRTLEADEDAGDQRSVPSSFFLGRATFCFTSMALSIQ